MEKYILIEILPLQSIEDLPSPETLNWADGVVLVYSITERGSFNFVKQVWNIFQVSSETIIALTKPVLSAGREK